MKISEMRYRQNSVELFSQVEDEPWSMIFDSGYPNIDSGRFDIIVARPFVTLETYGDKTQITTRDNQWVSRDDPFLLLKNYLGEPVHNLSDLPFCGGAVGYFSYDLSRQIESLPQYATQDIYMPDMAIGIYDWAIITDHHSRRTRMASFCRFQETKTQWRDLQDLFFSTPEYKTKEMRVDSRIHMNMDAEEYASAFNRIKAYIFEGDCYQVNLAQRFCADYSGNSWQTYLQLRQINPAPFSAYINLPAGQVLSSSPERFLRVVDQQVETRPIKGTRPRSVFAYEDKALAKALLESQKDRAENVMIVDLLRNDISKSCEPGSVVVPQLFSVESYAKVHHLVSIVTGRLRHDSSAVDLLRGCFPGGSITGAPKLRAMEIIEELEPHRRSVYCGSIGYIGFDGNMDSNICIRTMIVCQEKIYFYAGGGIVWDSKSDLEYQECFDKAAAIFELFSSKHIKAGRCCRSQ